MFDSSQEYGNNIPRTFPSEKTTDGKMFQNSPNNKSRFHPNPKSSKVRKGYVVPLKLFQLITPEIVVQPDARMASVHTIPLFTSFAGSSQPSPSTPTHRLPKNQLQKTAQHCGFLPPRCSLWRFRQRCGHVNTSKPKQNPKCGTTSGAESAVEPMEVGSPGTK